MMMNDSFKQKVEIINRNDPAAIDEMVRNGADLTETDDVGNSLLMWATIGHEKSARALIAGGADVNHRNERGYTALMWAVSRREAGVAALLIKHGADVNAKRNVDGNNALMLATMKGYAEIMHLLIENGADIEARNNKGAGAVDIAEKRSSPDVMRQLAHMIKFRQRHLEEAARCEEDAARQTQRAWRKTIDLEALRLRQRAPKVRLIKRPGM